MDKFAQLAWESDIAVGVLGLGTEAILFPLAKGAFHVDEEKVAAAHARGLIFCGVFGWVNNPGKMRMEMVDNPLVCAPMKIAVFEFAGMLSRGSVETILARAAEAVSTPSKPVKPPMGDSAEWLRQLHILPDARED